MTAPNGNPERPSLSLLDRFYEEPGGHIVLDRDLRVVEVGPEYLRLTLAHREGLIGKEYINTLSEPNAERHKQVVDLVQRMSAAALKTHQTQKYGPLRMDTKSAEDGHLEERWWRGAYIPVDDGGHQLLVHRVEDVTTECVIRRQLRAQRLSNYVLYGLVLAALAIVAWRLSVQSDENRAISLSNCRQVQDINKRLYTTVQGQLTQIQTPGNPTYIFYHRDHPDLLAQAVKNSNKALQVFAPKKCAKK